MISEAIAHATDARGLVDEAVHVMRLGWTIEGATKLTGAVERLCRALAELARTECNLAAGYTSEED